MTRKPSARPHEHHALALLKLIYRHGRLCRTDLASITGYSNFLVSRVCERLLTAGSISEVGTGDSTGGRRPTLLSVTPGLGRIIGLHVGTVNARVVVTDIAGNVLTFLKAPSLVQSGPDDALPHLLALIDKALGQAGVRSGELLGIGVGISGILDRASGVTLSWPKVPTWKNVPVRAAITSAWPTLVTIEDTPRTMALAERCLGRARDASEFLYLMIGAGVGSALFFGGRPYTGSSGFAGEFGHMALRPDGPVCDCGGRGCLESYISASALVRKAREAVSNGLHSELWHLSNGDPQAISVELIAQAADAGDRFSLRLVEETGTCLGEAVVCLVNLLNPELVVIGGGVAAALGKRILPTVDRIAREHALVEMTNGLRIELSQLQEADWAIGASLLVAEGALENAFYSGARPVPTAAPGRRPRSAHRAGRKLVRST
ncbi:MAG: ROK family protein [Bryobacteraceae bacterium]|nr:ROK family protein [Bryobacterales bacterium]MEB2362257.1 ROK family protein [Bryobacterales bacterium]NUN00013.1 ROK family protein [Bryobacteraceae bacterium]